MKKFILLLIPFLIAAAPTRQYEYKSGEVLSSTENNTNESALFNYLTAGVEVIKDDIVVNADINSSAAIQSSKLNLADITQDMSITATTTFNDSSNNNIVTIDNDGTGRGLAVVTDGVSTTGNPSIYIDNNQTEHGLYISQDGVLGTGRYGLEVYSNADQDASNLVEFKQDNASSDEAVFKITNDSMADSILDDSGAKLTYDGTWTDAPCTFYEKEDVKSFDASKDSEFINKLKNLNIYSYQRKVDVYGQKDDVLSETFTPTNKNDGRETINGKEYVIKNKKRYEVLGRDYPKEKKNPNAKRYIGYVLDDPSTPDELKGTDKDGNIIGIQAGRNTQFLLVVVKELIGRVEDLEKRVEVLEKK